MKWNHRLRCGRSRHPRNIRIRLQLQTKKTSPFNVRGVQSPSKYRSILSSIQRHVHLESAKFDNEIRGLDQSDMQYDSCRQVQQIGLDICIRVCRLPEVPNVFPISGLARRRKKQLVVEQSLFQTPGMQDVDERCVTYDV